MKFFLHNTKIVHWPHNPTTLLSYLSGRKQCVKIRNGFSLLKVILSGVPQASILGPILFNIFMNDIFFLLGSDLHKFADDNTVTAVVETIQGLINSLEVKTNNAIEWMKDNNMIANPDKFKAIVLTKTDHNTVGIRLEFSEKTIHPDKFKAIVLTKTDHNTVGIRLEFSEKTILSSNEIDLLGITIDTKLSFDSHIAKILSKASRQLNALKRLGFYIPLDTRKIVANSFIISNCNYCPLV